MRFLVKKSEVIVYLLFFSAFSALGVWQLKRADEKRSIENRIQERSISSTIQVEGPLAPETDQLEYQKVSVQGEFLPTGQLLIDNMMVDGKPGYHVISPLKIAGADWYIMVNRGWVAQGVSRQQLPSILTPAGQVSLDGIIRTPSALPFVESSMVPLSADEAYSIWLYLDLEKYAVESALKLLPFAMLQTSESTDELLREWPPYKAKVAMHIGYAIQWFGLAIVVSLIFFGVARKRARKEV